jgi:DNA-directed RNA polymerase subunit RPC12/RpoP
MNFAGANISGRMGLDGGSIKLMISWCFTCADGVPNGKENAQPLAIDLRCPSCGSKVPKLDPGPLTLYTLI